jgi:pilus assembly protein CpaE
MSSLIQTDEALRDSSFSVAVISPDRQRRLAATSTFAQRGNVEIHEFSNYPPSLEFMPALLERAFDVILIDLDGNPRFALEMAEMLCIARSAIVMVFSANADPELMLHSMRAGAREFFTLPFVPGTIAKALLWVLAHRNSAPAIQKSDGRLHVFFGSKGGVGVTTLSSNFAVALAEESGQSTLLIDLNLYMGDAAMNLGLASPYSIVDALQNFDRLDPPLLSKFLVHHSSGLAVLPAPVELPSSTAANVAIGFLLTVARQQFHHVVVDAGKKIDLKQMHLFEESATAYLVTQVGIPELRNANRLIAQFNAERSPKLEIVINRYQSRFLGLTDQHLTKALTRPAQWKIPNDYPAVLKMQTTSIPLVEHDSLMAAEIRRMAKSACCLPNAPETNNGRGIPKAGLRPSGKQTAKGPSTEGSHSSPALSLPDSFHR